MEDEGRRGEAATKDEVETVVDELREVIEAKATAHRLALVGLFSLLSVFGEKASGGLRDLLANQKSMVPGSGQSEAYKAALIEEITKLENVLARVASPSPQSPTPPRLEPS